MPCIYGLYSSADGYVRYVGQTTKPVAARLDQHVRTARKGSSLPLYRWMRSQWRAGHRVRVHIIQRRVRPAELNLFERYWVAQFGALLNRGATARGQDTVIAIAIHRACMESIGAGTGSRFGGGQRVTPTADGCCDHFASRHSLAKPSIRRCRTKRLTPAKRAASSTGMSSR